MAFIYPMATWSDNLALMVPRILCDRRLHRARVLDGTFDVDHFGEHATVSDPVGDFGDMGDEVLLLAG